jgi:UrcA family protein
MRPLHRSAILHPTPRPAATFHQLRGVLTMKLKRFALISAAVLVLGAGASFANADESSAARAGTAVKSVSVGYESVALDRAGGARSLHERLESAARRACGATPRDLRLRREWQECYDEALTQAIEDVADPRVAALR